MKRRTSKRGFARDMETTTGTLLLRVMPHCRQPGFVKSAGISMAVLFRYTGGVMGTKTRALSRDEFSALLTCLDHATGRLLPYAAVIAVIAGTGARVGEAREVTAGDLFHADGTPRPEVSRTLEKKKTKHPIRLTVPFPWDSIGLPIIRWREEARKRFFIHSDSPIFSVRYNAQPLNRQRILEAARVLMERAGIDPRGVGLHGIRKSLLREVYRFRRDDCKEDMMTALRHVQRLAGHAKFETTLIYLVDEIEGSHKDVINSVFKRLRSE